MIQQRLQTSLQHAESETTRLRHVNEALMLVTAEQRAMAPPPAPSRTDLTLAACPRVRMLSPRQEPLTREQAGRPWKASARTELCLFIVNFNRENRAY